MLCMIIMIIVQDSLNVTVDMKAIAGTTSMTAPSFEHIADVYTTVETTDIPLLWEIDTRINSVVGDILVDCFNATRKESISQGLTVVSENLKNAG